MPSARGRWALLRLGVRAAERRRGIGTALLRAADAWERAGAQLWPALGGVLMVEALAQAVERLRTAVLAQEFLEAREVIGVDEVHARIEQRGNQAGRGGLAVGARHCHRAFQPHQFGQHFRTAHHRHAVFERGDHFGVVALDRG